MRQQTRTNKHIVKYKGWTLVQCPWNSDYGKQFAKSLYDENGKRCLHAGYSKHCSHKELRLMIRLLVDSKFWENILSDESTLLVERN